MLHVVSPAKTQDFTTAPATATYSQPRFLEHSQQLIDELRPLAPHQVSELMHVSDKLGELNAQRFLDWHTPFSPDNAKQAVLAFKGDVYTGMAAHTYSEADFAFAQQHLRILSGLYGLLRPLDLIQPYRLEMGTGFSNSRGKNLYEFWASELTDSLNRELSQVSAPVLVNLASNEYWSAIQPRKLQGDVITPVFKDCKNGQYKIISFYAKKARGMMSAWIVKNRLDQVDGLKDFDSAGYGYNAAMSTAREWVFTRAEV